MSKNFSVIIFSAGSVLTAVLFALSVFRSDPTIEQNNSSKRVPTAIPVFRSRSYDPPSLSPVAPTPMLPLEKREISFKLQNFMPYSSDALSIGYSTLTDKFYIEQKNSQADEEFQFFLKKNGLGNIYDTYPDLFEIKSTNIAILIQNENNTLPEGDGFEVELLRSVPLTGTSTYQQQRKQNQTSSFNSLVKNLMTVKVPEATITKKFVVDVPLGGGITPTTAQVSTTQYTGSTEKPFIFNQPLSPAYKQNVQYDWGPYSCFNPPGQQSGAKAIQAYINEHWGGGTGYIGNCTPKNGKYSIHAEGRAVDSYFYVGDKMKEGNEAFGWLLTNASAIGIQYIKYWRVQWAAGNKLGLHCVTDARDQAVHSTHIHFELNWAGAKKQTPYFTQGAGRPSTIKIDQDVCPIVK